MDFRFYIPLSFEAIYMAHGRFLTRKINPYRPQS